MGARLFLALVMLGGMAVQASMARAAEDYVMLKIAGEEVKASEVKARWERLFPDGSAPAFEAVSPETRRNFLQGVIAEQTLYDAAKKAKFDEQPDVRRLLEQAQRQALVHAWLDAQAEDVVSEEVLKEAYQRKVRQLKEAQELRVSHILLYTEEEAREVYDALSAGKSFKSLAKSYSKDPVSAESGGDLGYLLPEDMHKAFADAALALKKGAVSTPVKTDLGWHIIKVENSRKPMIPPYHKMRDVLALDLKEHALSRYVSQLVKQAGVVVLNAEGAEQPLDALADSDEGFLF